MILIISANFLDVFCFGMIWRNVGSVFSNSRRAFWNPSCTCCKSGIFNVLSSGCFVFCCMSVGVFTICVVISVSLSPTSIFSGGIGNVMVSFFVVLLSTSVLIFSNVARSKRLLLIITRF